MHGAAPPAAAFGIGGQATVGYSPLRGHIGPSAAFRITESGHGSEVT
jgi:hypothetical protein